MPSVKFDVAIIGAGPAGSSAARVIAEHGFSVILVEKDESPGMTNVCGGGMPRSIFKDAGLSSDVVEKEILVLKHYFPWGERITKADSITVYRHVFDRHLAEKAVESGAKMMTSEMVRDIHIDNEGVRLITEKNIIESRLVIFADGPNTLAYRKYGIGFKPELDNLYVSVVCEVKSENNHLEQCEFYYGENITPWGYGWVFPRKNTLNVGVTCLYSKLHSNISDSLNYMLNEHPLTSEKLKEKEIVRRGSALIPAAPASRIFGERMLVAGDAAGMVDPVTGGGIMHAVYSGKLAGKICVMSLQEKDFSAKFLSQHQKLWYKTVYYSWIYYKFLASNVFLYLSRFDKNAYPKLAAITERKIIKLLDFKRS